MTDKEINIRDLNIDDINEDLLNYFNRYQEVKKVWRIENNKKVIKDISFIEQWDHIEKQNIIKGFREILNNNGIVLGAFEEGRLIAFASLNSTLLGENREYLQLWELHVSCDFRGRGIGKMLFCKCAEKAKELGVTKLYISAHSSIETMGFYTRMGCVDAQWIYKEQVELEPYDCQLEYVL